MRDRAGGNPTGVPPRPPSQELRRVLGTWSATALVVGGTIGSGIFLLPSLVAREAGSVTLVLALWAAGGAICLCGALAMSELGTLFPRAGGQYVYIREAFGAAPGFLFGWLTFALSYSGTIAAVAVAFATYLALFWPIAGFGVKLAAVALIWLLTLVNLAGMREGAAVQTISTAAKVGALVALVAAALFLPLAPAQAPALAPSLGTTTLAGLGLALGAILFAYDGFASATFVAAEMKDPTKTLPRASVYGVLIVIGIYLAANVAYLRVLGVEGVASSSVLASDVARAVLGAPGATLFAIAVLVSTFGLVNAYVIQSPRIYYEMARDRALGRWSEGPTDRSSSKPMYRGFAALNVRGVPAFGLILQAEWASLLVVLGSFEQLVGHVVVASWGFNALSGIALLRLRRTRADAPRPYRAPLWAVALFVAGSLFVVLVQLWSDPVGAAIGIGVTLAGLPLYFFFARAKTSS